MNTETTRIFRVKDKLYRIMRYDPYFIGIQTNAVGLTILVKKSLNRELGWLQIASTVHHVPIRLQRI